MSGFRLDIASQLSRDSYAWSAPRYFPMGTGAVNLRTLPNVQYEVNPELFFALTEKSVLPVKNQSIAGPSNFTPVAEIQQTGILSKIRLLVKGTLGQTANNPVTSNYKWPYGILRNIQLSANGQNNFISASGNDLRWRQRVHNKALVDTYTTIPTNAQLGAIGSYPFQVQIEIPIAMDDATLIGSLYAQSEAISLAYVFTTESMLNLFGTGAGVATLTMLNEAGTAATTPTVYMENTVFTIPYHPAKQGVLVIPDLSVLHSIIGQDNAVSGQASVATRLKRINGQLERLIFWTDNGTVAAPAAAVTPTSQYTDSILGYGLNEAPYTFKPQDMLRVRNMVDYRVALDDGVYCIDNVAENPARDQILLEGVTNLTLTTDYTAAFVPLAGANVHTVSEFLFA